MKPLLIVSLSVLALMLSACSASQDRPASGANYSPVGSWTLWLIQGETVEVAVPKTAKIPTLHINNEGEVSGTAGVNQYSAAASAELLAQNRFELGAVITTRMAGPPQAMELETRFLSLLQQARRYQSDGKTLALMDDSGVLLRFRADEANED